MANALKGRDLFRTVLLIIFLVALAYFFPYMPLFLLMVLVAALVAISLSDGALLLEKVGIPRKWGVSITLLSAVFLFMSIALVLSSPFYEATKRFLNSLPGTEQEALPFFKDLLESPLSKTPLLSTDFFSTMGKWFAENAAMFDLNLPALFPPVGTLVWQVLGALIIFMVLFATGVYIAMTPLSLLRIFLRLFNKDNRGRALKIINDLYEGLHAWPIATLLSIVAVGAMTSTAYWLLGLPSALLLGVVAGLLEVIPYFGAVIAAIPAVIVAISVSPTHVFLTILTIIVVQTINRNIIIPAVMSKVVKVHPALVAISVIPIYWIFGIFGIFLVVPICIVGKVLVRNLWIERPSRVRREQRNEAVTISESSRETNGNPAQRVSVTER